VIHDDDVQFGVRNATLTNTPAIRHIHVKMLCTTHICNEGSSALWPIHQVYSCTSHMNITTLLQQKCKCEHSNKQQCFTSINQHCTYQCSCTNTPFGIWKLPVSETSFLMNVIIRTRTLTITLEHICFCHSQLAGCDLRRGRDHLMWVLLQFISGSIQRNPASYVCGHTSD